MKDRNRTLVWLNGPTRGINTMNTATGVIVNICSEEGESAVFVPGERVVEVDKDWYFEKIEEVER
jgi:hypothetical protein